MRVLVFLTLFVVCALSLSPSEQFKQWMKENNRVYASQAETQQRFRNFKKTLERIAKHSKHNPKAHFGLNKFADLSEEEFAQSRKMPKVSGDTLAVSCLAHGVETDVSEFKKTAKALPAQFDWRDQGAVTPVKDQGACGSCWAFSTTGNIESQYFLKTKKLVQFSEQMLVDCSQGCSDIPGYGKTCNEGCNGGFQWSAFFDVANWKGIMTEDSYPYQGVDGTCQKDSSKLLAPITNYTCLSKGDGAAADEDVMAAYLVQKGPISIALNAAYLQSYTGGVIDPWWKWECNPNSLDHALLIVGYGVDKSATGDATPYWIIKNSWGDSWGENGYFRMARGKNICGLANAVSSSFF